MDRTERFLTIAGRQMGKNMLEREFRKIADFADDWERMFGDWEGRNGFGQDFYDYYFEQTYLLTAKFMFLYGDGKKYDNHSRQTRGLYTGFAQRD